MTRPGTFEDHVRQAFTEAVENGRDVERLTKLVCWCRARLKRECYQEYVDKCLADLSLLDPDPEMQGKLTNGDPISQAPSTNQGGGK
jgi:hypothetical protein